MGHGAKVIRARRAEDAPLRQRALKVLELYQAMPAETRSQKHIAALMARLEIVVGDGPVLRLVRAAPPSPVERGQRDSEATG